MNWRDIRRYNDSFWVGYLGGDRGGEGGQTRANANSSRLADIKFAFILCSVIYDTDLSHAVDVRTLVIVFSVRVYRRNKRRRSNWAEWKKKKEKKKENEQQNREVKRAANEKNESDTNGTKKSEIILALQKRLEVIAQHFKLKTFDKFLKHTYSERYLKFRNLKYVISEISKCRNTQLFSRFLYNKQSVMFTRIIDRRRTLADRYKRHVLSDLPQPYR